ncbi:MAG: hypothetical protein ACR2IP_01040 [Solirubrobacteraceae bacterium]
MTSKQFSALLGFAFVAAWIGFGFGDAILCVLGAGVLYLVAGVREGEIDLGQLQDRLRGKRSPTNPAPRTSTFTRSRTRARVQ